VWATNKVKKNCRANFAFSSSFSFFSSNLHRPYQPSTNPQPPVRSRVRFKAQVVRALAAWLRSLLDFCRENPKKIENPPKTSSSSSILPRPDNARPPCLLPSSTVA
jgi:hypothetical protein